MTGYQNRQRFLSFADAVTPPQGRNECFLNYWWLVHPEKGLIFWSKYGPGGKIVSPAANLQRKVHELMNWAPPLEVRQFSAVFVPINIEGEYVL